MKKITQEEFSKILDLHDKWLRDIPEGQRANLSITDLSKINMERAYMKWANMAGANMAGAYMAGANMEGANMEGANMERAYMVGANMEGANMEGANMERANMAGANMEGAYMERANMERANMAGANMEGAYMEEKYGKLVGKRPVIQIGNIGRDNAFMTATICEKGIVIRRGCFYGSIEEFEEKVREVHLDSVHGKEYAAAIAFIRNHAELWKESK